MTAKPKRKKAGKRETRRDRDIIGLEELAKWHATQGHEYTAKMLQRALRVLITVEKTK